MLKALLVVRDASDKVLFSGTFDEIGSLQTPDFADWACRLFDRFAKPENEIFVFAYGRNGTRFERTIPVGASVIPDRASILFDMMFTG